MTDPIEEPGTFAVRSAHHPVGGWLEPTSEQMEDARNALAGTGTPEIRALHYIGAVLNRVRAAEFDADSLRRAIAMYRVYDEEMS